MDSGSTPVPHSELVSDLTVEADASLQVALEIEHSNERNDMKVGTKLTISGCLRSVMKVTLVMIIVGLLGFGAGPVASIGLSFCSSQSG